jgi:hypothetical protein
MNCVDFDAGISLPYVPAIVGMSIGVGVAGLLVYRCVRNLTHRSQNVPKGSPKVVEQVSTISSVSAAILPSEPVQAVEPQRFHLATTPDSSNSEPVQPAPLEDPNPSQPALLKRSESLSIRTTPFTQSQLSELLPNKKQVRAVLLIEELAGMILQNESMWKYEGVFRTASCKTEVDKIVKELEGKGSVVTAALKRVSSSRRLGALSKLVGMPKDCSKLEPYRPVFSQNPHLPTEVLHKLARNVGLTRSQLEQYSSNFRDLYLAIVDAKDITKMTDENMEIVFRNTPMTITEFLGQ